MSLINDALKRARQAPPRSTPSTVPPLQPAAEEPSPMRVWLIPVGVVVMIVVGIFAIAFTSSRHTVKVIATTPVEETDTNQTIAEVIATVVPTPEPPPTPLNQPEMPKLQGIFYSPTKPTAIVEGKIVGPGDQFRQYRVKEIGKYTVTLVGPDKKEIKLGMGN